MEKMAREIMERVMKGEAFPAIVKRVVEIVHEELGKVAKAEIKEPEARNLSLITPSLKFPDIDNPEEFKERLEKMPDLVASVTVLNEEPSGYCPSDLPGRGRNAPKAPKTCRFWRRSK
jgi:hypothetical protein